MNEQITFSNTDSEIVAEWIYFAVLANHTNDSVMQLIELTLASTFLDQALISEQEIDEAIRLDLDMLKEDFGERGLTKAQFDQQYRQSVDREIIKKELIEASAGEQFEEGLAACEFLAALLGLPSEGFLAVIASYGEEAVNSFTHISKQYDANRLRMLTPKALDVLAKSKNSESAKAMGISNQQDIESWFESIAQLENNLS